MPLSALHLRYRDRTGLKRITEIFCAPPSVTGTTCLLIDLGNPSRRVGSSVVDYHASSNRGREHFCCLVSHVSASIQVWAHFCCFILPRLYPACLRIIDYNCEYRKKHHAKIYHL